MRGRSNGTVSAYAYARLGDITSDQFRALAEILRELGPIEAPGARGPGVEVRVVDAESGAVVDPGRIGVLEVRGPNVFAGYWRQPEKTAEDLRPDGFFVTGDLVEIDDDSYVHIVGRAKDLIISGGLNVYPKEVEDLIDALPGVTESAVFGVPHPDFGEAVVAAVVPRADGAVDGPSVLAGLDGQLARFKQPKAVFVVDELPRNAMAKVQKAALREEYGGTFA